MINKIFLSVVISALLMGCSGLKKTTEAEAVTPKEVEAVAPAEIEFKTYNDIVGFSQINIPLKGNGFEAKNLDRTDKLPTVMFHSAYTTVKASFSDKQGDFSTMFEILKPKYGISDDDNTTTIFKETEIGTKQVALIDNVKKNRNGSLTFTYGYMIKHGDQMGVIMVYYANFTPSQVETRRPILEETLQYMIQTLEFS